MATSTTRLGLRKPANGDVVNVVSDVNANMDKIDSSINLFPCISSTKPALPYTGQLILLTDAQVVQCWTGSQWVTIGGSGALGKMGLANITADSALQNNASGETGPHMSITFTADASRRYWVESLVSVVTDGGSGVRSEGVQRLRRAAGASVTTAGTQVGNDCPITALRGPNGAKWSKRIWEITPGISGQTTVGFFVIVPFDTDSLRIRATGAEYKGTLVVRDVGV